MSSILLAQRHACRSLLSRFFGAPLFATLASFVAACASAPAPAGHSAAQTAAAPPAAAAVEAAPRPGDPVVTLIAPGNEPRTALRYHIPIGTKGAALMRMEMAMANAAEGAPKPARPPTIPVIEMLAESEVVAPPLPDGIAVVSTLVAIEAKAGSPDSKAMVEMMATQLKTLVGLRMSGTMSPRGAYRDVKVEVPPGVSPLLNSMISSMRSVMEQAAIPWPVEPVGEGASWRVESKIETSNFKIAQVGTYTLQKREGQRLVLAVKLDQSAPPQEVPAGPPGATMSLAKYEGSGTGETSIQLDKLVPTAKTALVSTMVGTVVANERRVPLHTRTELKMAIAPK